MISPVHFAKALADTTRWRIIRLVRHDALCVCELADILEMPQSSVSSHVQILRRADLLESESCGKWSYFRIRDRFHELLSTLENLCGPASDPAAAVDESRKLDRLALRASSYCPGPKILTHS